VEIKKTILLLIIVLQISACEEVIQKPIQSANTDLLVVEAILTNEKTNHLIKLSKTFPNQNGSAIPVSGAVLKIEDTDSVYNASEFPAGSGRYYTETMRAVFGKKYTLSIQYQGKSFTAEDSSVPVEPLPPLPYEKIGDQYRLVLTERGRDPNYIDCEISWNKTPSCVSGASCEGRVVFYDLKTLDVNNIYKPKKADFTFPLNSVVVRRKYSVSPAYQSFLRSVLSETEWRGGVFDVQRANAATNLSEGAIGFFAVSTVVSDTTLIVEKP